MGYQNRLRRLLNHWVLSPTGRGMLGVLGFFALSEVFTRLELVNPNFLPPASSIVARFFGLFTDGPFVTATLETLQSWFIGLGLTLLIAVPVGILLGSSDRLYRMSSALIELVRPVPGVAVLPLAILLFGQSPRMKVFLIVISAIWPMLFNTIYGVHDVEPLAKETARAFGYGRLSILWKVSLPSALPFIMTGVRVSASIALLVLVSAELLAGAAGGIGSWIIERGAVPGNARSVFAGSVFAAFLGYAVNFALEVTQRRFLGWHAAMNRGAA